MPSKLTPWLFSLALAFVAASPASATAPTGAGKATSSARAGNARMLLALGAMKTEPKHSRLSQAMSVASRSALGELPGVRLLAEGEDAEAAAARRKPPVVLITGKLLEVGQAADGAGFVVSAKVEYLVHRMPGHSIAAVVSGSARAKVSSAQVRKRPLREKLEQQLVAAAVESAVKRTAPALKAALD